MKRSKSVTKETKVSKAMSELRYCNKCKSVTLFAMNGRCHICGSEYASNDINTRT